jgi:hypothetical protein
MQLAAKCKDFFMQNPFDVIIEKLESLESKLNQPSALIAIPQAEIIDRVELCKRLSITTPTAMRWEKKGKIPYFRLGSNVRYNWTNVINTLEGKTKGGIK